MRRVTRSKKHRMIAGVAGGLAEYFDIDPLIPRILFIVSLFWNGGGLLVYIILWIVLPVKDKAAKATDFQEKAYNEGHTGSAYEDAATEATTDQTKRAEESVTPESQQNPAPRKTNLITGLVLIFLGLFFLLDQILPAFYFEHFWPLAIVILGVALLLSGLKET